MKKLLALILTLVMVFSVFVLASCDDNNDTSEETSSSSSSSSASESSTSSSSQPTAEELLREAKDEKLAQLDTYAAGKDVNLLTDEGKSTFAPTVAEQKSIINAVTDIAALDTALANAKTAIDAYCNANLVSVKIAEFKAAVQAYADEKTVDAANETDFSAFVTSEQDKLDSLTSVADMNTQLAASKLLIDAKVQEYIEAGEDTQDASVRNALNDWYNNEFLNSTQYPTDGMLDDTVTAMKGVLDSSINALLDDNNSEFTTENDVKDAVIAFYNDNKDTKTVSLAIAAAKSAFDTHLSEKYSEKQVNRIKNDAEGSNPSTYDSLVASLNALNLPGTTQTAIDNKLAEIKAEAYMVIYPWTILI